MAVMVLAAGASTRLGQPKQLLSFREKPLLQHVLDAAAPLFTKRLLVLGAYHQQIQTAIGTSGWQVIFNPKWSSGMASSIRLGLQGLLSTQPDVQAALILLADQPHVTTNLLIELAEQHTCATFGITACQYGRVTGVPAVFDRRYFAQLMTLTGDAGARFLIKENPEDVQTIPFETGNTDIDTLQDYESLLKNDNILQENHITVRYFGEIAEKTGKSVEYLQADVVGGSLEGLKAYCLQTYGLAPGGSIKLAVNQVLRESASIGPGDEVALLPPFSGG